MSRPRPVCRELEKSVSEIETMLHGESIDSVPFTAALDRLDTLLRKIGGKLHPKTFWSDNLEVILVAAIIVIGVRTLFLSAFHHSNQFDVSDL